MLTFLALAAGVLLALGKRREPLTRQGRPAPGAQTGGFDQTVVAATRSDLLHLVEDLQKVHEPTTHHPSGAPADLPTPPNLPTDLPLTFPPVPDLLFVQILKI